MYTEERTLNESLVQLLHKGTDMLHCDILQQVWPPVHCLATDI